MLNQQELNQYINASLTEKGINEEANVTVKDNGIVVTYKNFTNTTFKYINGSVDFSDGEVTMLDCEVLESINNFLKDNANV